ncbi:hypothetical protein RB195_001378 [Necator americanus]|uniref:Uncharacterized protein n=1 Tax=Necator americanus TaxID=51031 RepID=A0ABR1DE21_NECAM
MISLSSSSIVAKVALRRPSIGESDVIICFTASVADDNMANCSLKADLDDVVFAVICLCVTWDDDPDTVRTSRHCTLRAI